MVEKTQEASSSLETPLLYLSFNVIKATAIYTFWFIIFDFTKLHN